MVYSARENETVQCIYSTQQDTLVAKIRGIQCLLNETLRNIYSTRQKTLHATENIERYSTRRKSLPSVNLLRGVITGMLKEIGSPENQTFYTIVSPHAQNKLPFRCKKPVL